MSGFAATRPSPVVAGLGRQGSRQNLHTLTNCAHLPLLFAPVKICHRRGPPANAIAQPLWEKSPSGASKILSARRRRRRFPSPLRSHSNVPCSYTLLMSDLFIFAWRPLSTGPAGFVGGNVSEAPGGAASLHLMERLPRLWV